MIRLNHVDIWVDQLDVFLFLWWRKFIQVFIGKDSITFMTSRIRANQNLIHTITWSNWTWFDLCASFTNLFTVYCWKESGEVRNVCLKLIISLNKKTFKRIHAYTLVCASMLWKYWWALDSESQKILSRRRRLSMINI